MKNITKIALVAAALSLSACSKLTQENYDKIEAGMSKVEIEDILGKADDCSKTMGVEKCIWGKEDGKNITIGFIGDMASTFTNDGLK